jgi:D-threo-aldose 1-dehydrogenase
MYGVGQSEARYGRALRGVPRDDFVLSTKVGRVLRPGAAGQPPTWAFDFSAAGVRASFESSLTRLGLERVDILFVHDPDDHHAQAVAEAFPVLMELRAQGKVKAIGAGMNQWQMELDFARLGFCDCFLLAGRYTLLDQGALDALFPACREKNIGILLGGIYNSGILANPHAGAKFNYQDADASLVARALELDELCRKHGTQLKAAALQFCMAHPAVTVAVMGARNAAEVADNIAMSEAAVPPAFWQELRARNLVDARAPLPGGA